MNTSLCRIRKYFNLISLCKLQCKLPSKKVKKNIKKNQNISFKLLTILII